MSADERRFTEQLRQHILDEFDLGWDEFMKEVQIKIDRSNERLFAVLFNMMGETFIWEVKEMMKKCKCHDAFLKIVRETDGMRIKTKNIHIGGIDEYYLDVSSGEGGMKNTVSIPVKDGRWIQFTFYN